MNTENPTPRLVPDRPSDWLSDLHDQMMHCVSAADEGEDYAVSRPMLDAMTALGLMEKVGRGKWAPTDEGMRFAAARRESTLPIDVRGEWYEVPIPVHLHVIALRDAAAPPAEAPAELRSTHHVHRGPESLPCYCAGTSDHPIGQEAEAPAKRGDARTLEAVRAKLSPSEWAILCAAFSEVSIGREIGTIIADNLGDFLDGAAPAAPAGTCSRHCAETGQCTNACAPIPRVTGGQAEPCYCVRCHPTLGNPDATPPTTAPCQSRVTGGREARPLDDWHEDYGPVVWWKFPIDEPAWIGGPNDSDWPGYHTHWTPHPDIPALQAANGGGDA